MNGCWRAGLLAFLPWAMHGAAPNWVMTAAAQPVPSARSLVVLDASEHVDFVTETDVRSTYRWVARLQRDSGRKNAVYAVGYDSNTDPIISASAWVISPAGRIHVFHRSDFIDFSADARRMFWTPTRYLEFAASNKIAPGDVLAVEVVIERRGVFETGESFAPRLLTIRETFDATPPPGERLVWHASAANMPPPQSGATAGALHWELSPPAPLPEVSAPTNFLANPCVIHVHPDHSPLRGGWPAASALAYSIIGPRMVCSAALHAQAEALTAGKAARWAKIRALAEFVQQRIVYLSLTDDTDSYAGMRPHWPADVASNRFGDCKDKATLLVTMLRAIGDNGHLLLVTLGDPKAIDPEWTTLGFDHVIVAIPGADAPADWPTIDAGPLGRMVVFDPTDSLTPLGILAPQDQAGWCLLVDPQYGRLLRLPVMDSPQPMARTDVEGQLADDGLVEAVAERDFTGTEAAAMYALRYEQPREAVVAGWTRGLETFLRLPRDVIWKDNWRPDEGTYHVHLSYSGYAGRRLGDSLMAVGPQFARGVPEMAPWQTSAAGVAWMPAHSYLCHTRLKLPAGWQLEEMPDDWIRQGKTTQVEIRYKYSPGELDYTSRFSIHPGFYDQSRYETIRAFLAKVEQAESRPVLLRHS